MITFIHAVMGAGKTTQLLINAYNTPNCLIIKPTTDTRDGVVKHQEWGTINSRPIIGKFKALYLEPGKEWKYDFTKVSKIFVDETQFFKSSDIAYLCKISDTFEIPTELYGLKTDAYGQLFEGAAAALALADEIREIPFYCKCGRKATMHHKIGGSGNVIDVESKEVRYESVCRECYGYLTQIS